MNRTRHHALRIFRAALQAADPESAVLKHVSFDGRVFKAGRKRYPLSAFDRIQVIGAGKADAAMARALEIMPELLGSGAQKAMLSLHSRNAGDPGTDRE